MTEYNPDIFPIHKTKSDSVMTFIMPQIINPSIGQTYAQHFFQISFTITFQSFCSISSHSRLGIPWKLLLLNIRKDINELIPTSNVNLWEALDVHRYMIHFGKLTPGYCILYSLIQFCKYACTLSTIHM